MKYNNIYYRKHILFFVCLVVLQSCIFKEQDLLKPEGYFESDWLLPLAYGNLSIENLTEGSSFSQNSDKLLIYTSDSEQNLLENFQIDTVILLNTPIELDFETNISSGTGIWGYNLGGVLAFSETRFGIEVENGLGLPLGIKINQIRASNSRNGTSRMLIGNIDSFYVPAATQTPFTPGIANFMLDELNSNAEELMNLLPDNVNYKARVSTFPDNNSFYQPNSELNMRAFFEVPLNVFLENFGIRDTLDFSLDLNTSVEGDSNENLQIDILGGALYIKTSNFFPLALGLKVYFIDKNNTILDSLHNTPNGISISSATPNANGRTEEPSIYLNDIQLDKAKADRLNAAEKIVVEAILNSDSQIPQGFVKIYADYILGFTLSGQLKLNTNFKL